MTVNTENSVTVLTGNGVTTVFPFNFKVLDESHLIVERRPIAAGLVDKVYTTGEYTIQGLGDENGSVTLGTALTAGNQLVIRRIVPYTQELDIVNQGGFYPETVEEQLDLTTMQIQQLAEKLGRTISVPPGESGIELPPSPGRDGYFPVFLPGGGIGLSSGLGGDSGLRADLASTVSGAAIVAFLQSGIGAVVRTVQAKLRDTVNVKDFGAAGDGVTDDTANIQKALDAVGLAGGGTVLFPAGQYKISAALLVSYANVTLRGAGKDATTIFTTSTTINIIRFYNATAFTGGGVFDLSTSHTNVAAAGTDILVDGASAITIENIWCRKPFQAVLFQGNNRACRAANIDVSDHSGDAFTVSGGGNQYIHNCTTFNNVPGGGVAFRIYQTDATWLTNCVTQQAAGGLWVIPGSTQHVTDLWITDCDFDASTLDNIVFNSGTTGGRITRVFCNSSRSGFGGRRGVVVDGNNTRHLNFDSLSIEKHVQGGLVINNGFKIVFNQLQCVGNASLGGAYNAIEVYGGDAIQFIGGCSGAYSTDGNNQRYGIAFLVSFTGDALVIGMDLRGNVTGAVFDAATGATIRFEGCPGYNPGGLTIVTPGASPYTYTAGRSRETLYIRGGTVTDVKITAPNGTLSVFNAVSSCTVNLEPGEACIITYSAAPTVIKNVA